MERIGSDALTTVEQRRVLGTEEPGLFFPAVLKLSRQTLQAGQRQVPLQPGMSLVADVHLRNRRPSSTLLLMDGNVGKGCSRLSAKTPRSTKSN